MKYLIIALLLIGGTAIAQEPTLVISGEPREQIIMSWQEENMLTHEFSITIGERLVINPDGQITIDGKPLERLSDPEIKKSLAEIAKGLRDLIDQQDTIKYLNRQTDMLLKQIDSLTREVENCRNKP